MDSTMLRIDGLSRTFGREAGALVVLNGVTLSIGTGELCALTGSSGSGKSTLMNLIALLDQPSEGEIWIRGIRTSSLSDDEASRLRGETIGFVFQAFHLLPRLTAVDNVGLPLIYRGIDSARRRELAAAALGKVGLQDRLSHRPDELSGGQRQRVAIARALVTEPSLLLADEPTGNLDSGSADEIMTLFLLLNRLFALTIVIVTHDPTVAARCPRRIVLRDGQVFDDNRGELRRVEAPT
jgi:putative ABC transport system ATP-binding protein